MTNFLLATLQYVLIMLGLAAVGGIGTFIGIKLRKSKNAKMNTEE